jgi:hypothetical protein
MKSKTFCQSCYMPITTDFGTEKDGKLSKEYCSYCYQNGKWTSPDITFDEIIELGKKGINGNTEMGRFMKWFCKITYPSMLKKTKRWK